MVSVRSTVRHLILFFLLLFTLVQLTAATSTSFTVRSGEEATRVLKLAVEDRVFISFSVVGGDNAIRFCLACPNGTVRDFGEVGYFHHTFVCDLEGDYTLHFSNVGSSVDKLVTLNYEVEHYIFGVPQMLFLTIVIAIVCVVMVAAFILLGRSH
ncbi:MAG: hypothetical protein ACPL0C_07210 [Candidatus Bathyarchaeales archaeon]